MNILSIYTSHDGCITYTSNNKIIFHTQIDRYNRFKHSTLPTKLLIEVLEKLEIDIILLSHLENHSSAIWYEFFQNNKKLKKVPIFYYGDNFHHMFHAYCSLTWNKNLKNILVCDGRGIKYKDSFENESHFIFEKKLKHIRTESNYIGMTYQEFTKKYFDHELDCGKTMAWSLYDEKPKKLQENFENSMFQLIKKWNLKDEIVFTGGCAQNILFNSKLLKINKNLFCDPFNGDFGISLGAINYYTNNSIVNDKIYLGIPQDLNLEIFSNHTILNTDDDEVSSILINEPVAIFQSRSEQGQRGLGNRSLLMNPSNEHAQNKLNDIKKREWFRPFACSILLENTKEWFDMDIDESPYMMYAFKIKDNKKNILKTGLSIDYKSRIQTVSKEDNLHYYNLIKSFYKKTNIPLLANTSLNLPGEVLVETLYDLKKLFEFSCLNYIYFPEIKKIIKK